MKIFESYLPKEKLAEDISIEHVELRGFSRSVAELEWLLLILVLLYSVAPSVQIENTWTIIQASLLFAAFILSFHYINFYESQTRWKLAIEVWVMILFVTWILWNTGRIDSPLINLYLLVIITSGLTLGKLTTFMILALITAVYFWLGFPLYAGASFSLENFGRLFTIFTPYLLVAYLTTMLSADLHYARKMFKHLAECDELTGLHNIRSFSNTLQLEIKKSNRYKHVFSILMIDADNLKSINDEFGHEAGNQQIITMANTINSCLRESDILGRYGGDEFIALLPETPRDHALEVGDRIRKAIENTAFDMEGHQISSTVSIGVASFPEDAANLDDLLQKADRAMYKSKKEGRNKISLYATN